MSMIHFPFADAPGVARDVDAYQLPLGVWSDGLNVLFRDKKVSKAFGYASFIASPTIAGRRLAFCPVAEVGFWAYMGLTDIRAFDGAGTTAEITRAAGDYTGGEDNLWTFTYFHGLGIFTNGVDAPQLWSPPSLSQVLVNLTNWPASYTAKCIRSFGSYLIALDVTDAASVRYPTMVKWSHAASPGTVPSSWDETDATVDAGEHTLSETPGSCVDALPLGQSNLIYKEDSIFAMTHIGGQFIFGFRRLPFQFGTLGLDCVAQLPRQHFVVTGDDIVVHDGIQAVSVIEKRNRTWLFNNIEPAALQNSYTLNYTSREEIWFMFALAGSTIPTMALIWNAKENSTSFREIPVTRHMLFTPAIKISAGDSWDFGADAGGDQWNGESTLTWDDASFKSTRARVFAINEDDSTIDEYDEDIYTDAGANVRSYIERQSMPFIGTNQGQTLVDLDTVKFVHEIWPRITGAAGVQVSVYFGTQMLPDDTVTWADPVTFTIGTTEFVPVYKSCRLFSVRFEATDSNLFSVAGFSYSLEPAGKF